MQREKRGELDALFTLSALEPENDNRRLEAGAALDSSREAVRL